MLKNRLVMGYLVLVGLPLLFLVGTLRAGRSLSAPPAVSGEWIVQPLDAPPANHALPPALSIYQAGAELLVTLRDPAKTQFAAQMENGHIAGAGGRLEATLGGPLGHRVLEGQIDSVRFRASRPAATPR